MRILTDSNVFVSALITAQGTPARVLELALRYHQVLISEKMLTELLSATTRPKLDRYLPAMARAKRLAEFSIRCHPVPDIAGSGPPCRDPKDQYLADLAAAHQPDLLISGDRDLLALHPIGVTRVVTPTEALALLQ